MGKEKQIIMLVDDNQASLTMGKNILKDKYNLYPIASGDKLFEILQKVIPDLILLDISMPEMDGYEIIRKLKADQKTEDIPVIFLTSRDDPGNELEGLSMGAIDYISKPFSPALLLQRINNHLILASRKEELEKNNQQLWEMTLGVIVEAAICRQETVSGRGRRIQNYIKILLDAYNENEQYQDEITTWDLNFLLPAFQLHDLGMILVKDTILGKKEALTNDEFDEIKKHPVQGIKLIEQISPKARDHVFLDYAKIITGSHHEKWDGTGYPQGLKGTEIPLLGRIMALADGYDALISPRPHRGPFSSAEAGKIIIEGKGTWLDPGLVDIFREHAPGFAEIANSRN